MAVRRSNLTITVIAANQPSARRTGRRGIRAPNRIPIGRPRKES